MTLGLIMYFYYGITHSSLENPSEEFELTVDNNGSAAQNLQINVPSTTTTAKPSKRQRTEPTAVWDRHGYENRMATNDDGEYQWSGANQQQNNTHPYSWNTNDAWGDRTIYDRPPQSANIFQPPPATTTSEAKKDGFGMFYNESASYPTWDD